MVSGNHYLFFIGPIGSFAKRMRIVAIILSVICLIYVGAKLVEDLGNFYFDTLGFYGFLCLCFIVNLIALWRSKKTKH